MTGPLPSRRMLVLAAASVFWERLWRRLWPAASLAATFLALALLDVLPALPGWLHAGTLALFVAAAVVALAHAWPALRPVDRATALRRIESDSGLAHGPLAALHDEIAAGAGDRLAEALWSRHRQRMAQVSGALRVRWPHPDVARLEPWGIRCCVVLLLAVGLAAGAGHAPERILRAVSPEVSLAARGPVGVEVWITPPAYTGAAPQFLSTAAPSSTEAAVPGRIDVPRGSAVLARVIGARGSPTLRIGDAVAPFSPLDGGDAAAFRAEASVLAGDHLTVERRGRTLASWAIRVIPDHPPRAEFRETPAQTGNGLLQIGFAASDDYGVSDLVAVGRRDPADASTADDIRVPLPLSGADVRSVEGATIIDLSAHPWAGSAIRMHLAAGDAAGQVTNSPAISVTLPERHFKHPVARAIIQQRKRLTDDPAPRGDVAAALAAIAAARDSYDNDVVVMLALAVAKSRLRYEGAAETLITVRDLLWKTALRIEEGDVSTAEQALVEARRRLSEALDQGASMAEIERLMDALQEALEAYLSAVARDLAKRSPLAPAFDPAITRFRADDLHDLIEMARQLARSGARRSAQDLLGQVNRLLDQIRAGRTQTAPPEAVKEAHALMQALRSLQERQQSLLEDTFAQMRELRRRSEPGRPPSAAKSQARANEQRQVRGDLAALAERLKQFLGTLPAPLNEAGRAMRGAAQALQEGQLGEAVTAQGAAVDALGRALDAVGQAMTQRLGGPAMLGEEGEEGETGGGDAFGRMPGQGARGAGVGSLRIPDRSELQRAEEILRELRRRASDFDRPGIERDYLERLLRRF